MSAFPIHVRTLTGLEEVLADELREVGAEEIQTGKRIVRCIGSQRTLYRANAFCRTAIRILKPIHHFAAKSEKELYRLIGGST